MKRLALSTIEKNYSFEDFDKIIYWHRSDSIKDSSVQDYLDKHKKRIREKYLRFIFKLSEKKIDGKSLSDFYKVDDFHNLWRMSLINEKCPVKSIRIVDCLKLICLEEILKINKVTHLSLYTDDINLNKSIKDLCSSMNINFSAEKINIKGFILNYIYLPYFLRAFYFIIRYTVKNLSFDSKNKLKDISAHGVIFTNYFLNYQINIQKEGKFKFKSNYWDKIPNLLSKKNKITWLHMPVDTIVQKNVKKDISLLLNNKKNNHILFKRIFSFKILIISIAQFIYFYFKSISVGNLYDIFSLKESSINFYHLMKYDWNKSFIGPNLFYSLATINTFDFIFSNIANQKYCFYLLENQSWEKALISSWRKYDHGKLIGSSHSTIRFWDLRYFFHPMSYRNRSFIKKEMPDYLTINGNASKKLLKENYYPKNKLIEVEAIRFNYLINFVSSNGKNSKGKNILLIGDINIYNTKSMLNVIGNIDEPIKKDYSYIFRPHPGTNIYLKKNLAFIKKTKGTSLNSDIKKSDIIIVSGSSSVAVETLILGKKLIVFNDKRLLNLSPLSEINEVSFVSTTYQLNKTLLNLKKEKNYVKKDIFWLDNKLKKWKSFLRFLKYD